MSTTEEPETLADVLRRAHATPQEEEADAGTVEPQTAEEGGTLPVLVTSADRTRVQEADGSGLGPISRAIRRQIPAELVADAYLDALTATRTVRFKGGEVEEPDYATRLRAADAVTNRLEGTPIARSELTGAGGGPLTLQALLAADPRATE